jgi:hypothetical protein
MREFDKAPQVETQNGTAYVRGIFQRSARGGSPDASTFPWLINVSTVPTTNAVTPDRRKRDR